MSGYVVESTITFHDGVKRYWRNGHGWKKIEKATIFHTQNKAIDKCRDLGGRECCGVFEVKVERTVGAKKYPAYRLRQKLVNNE
tara:strand:- start:4102 stop:4353 length:252 start_codon:yes stop_codon:yes gene_type:complete